MLPFLITLPISSPQLIEDANTSVATDNDELIFGHFTLTALVVISTGTLILAICTAIACYIDFANVNRGIGKLAVCPETAEMPYPDILTTVGSWESEKRLKEGSSAETVPAKISDLAAEAKQLPQVMQVASRMNAEARQARIIEAIYHASGREVPPQYKSKVVSKDKIDIPERIQETLEGIADKDVNGEGSPVASPSRFAQFYSLPPLKSKEDDRTDLTTTATLREIWMRPPRTQGQPTASVVALDATQRAPTPAQALTPVRRSEYGIDGQRSAMMSSMPPGMGSVRARQTSTQPQPSSEAQRRLQGSSTGGGVPDGAEPAAAQSQQPDQKRTQ